MGGSQGLHRVDIYIYIGLLFGLQRLYDLHEGAPLVISRVIRTLDWAIKILT